LLGTGIPPEIISVLFFFTPILLLLIPRGIGEVVLIVLAELMMLSRLIEVMLDTRGKMIVSGIGVGLFLIFLPALFWRHDRRGVRGFGQILGSGLFFGVVLSILFRVLNRGWDISTYRGFQAIGWALAVIAGTLIILESRAAEPHSEKTPDRETGMGRLIGQSLGLMAALALLYFAFTAPNVIARWTGQSHLFVLAWIGVSVVLFAFLLWARPSLVGAFAPGRVIGGNLIFVLAMVFTILPHQLRFPSDPSRYPFFEPSVSPWFSIPLVLMLLLFPIVVVDFALLSEALSRSNRSLRAFGGSFTLAAGFFLIMVFAQVFTTTYDYIPVVGPFFRDKFWLVYLTLGVVLLLSILLVSRESYQSVTAPPEGGLRVLLPVAMIVLFAGVMLGGYFTLPKPATPLETPDIVRILTYNLQQGYSEEGLKNFDGQLELIRQVDADIIGLQETDTNRIAGGNADLIWYLAGRLNLYAYYGPKVVPGTFGIALLSKYPIHNPRTFYMYSQGEQTATIHAEISIGDETYQVYVTHLGNGGPIIQQQNLLEAIAARQNVILMGDFNFRPDTAQYVLTTARFSDAWMLRWSESVNPRGTDHGDQIDHVFLSPGMTVRGAQYIFSPASDHPALVVELER
jgi:endonuclease/exonuclease/phosphatase family metal-dependent hydrolase